jgi:hypothetical protein
MPLQEEYCKIRGTPMFVSKSGRCWSCKRFIPDTDKEYINGCPFCATSFCE